MDYFTRQDQARRNTRWLIFLFVIAVVGIVIAVDMVVMLVLASGTPSSSGLMPTQGLLSANAGLLFATSALTSGFIGVASLYKVSSLRSGGGKVARDLGGTRVTADASDPAWRRLLNVVEEMAIASGLPVPEVYVLEDEPGINAFAAGSTPSDAAVAVTSGCLEQLSRDELQGVIGHEFSHILNGDMRLNIRLMGLLFGIVVIGLIGRILLRGSRGARFSGLQGRRNGKGAGGIVVLGLGLTVIGYIGVLCARLIRAAVSRQREFLADASAVQFSRNPAGLAGALKKIGGFSSGSGLHNPDGEEISHMLFAINTQSFSSLFATHPPLEERIRALQPGFRGRAQKGGETQGEHQVDMAAGLAPGQSAAQSVAQVHLRPEQVSALVGNPGHEHVVQAMALRGAVAESVYAATQSPESALHLCLALVLAQDIEARAAQLAWIEQHYDIPTQTQVASLFVALQAMGPGYRLPLLELVFPALKRRAEAEIERLMLAIQQLVRVDERIDTYEYLVLRMLRSQLLDVNPQLRMRPRASLSLAECGEEAATVLAILAHQAHDDAGDAQSACAAGGAHLSLAPALASKSVSADWMTELDDALTCLDTLAAQHKARLVEAMVKVVMHDGALALTEAELLRAICSALHCPLPPLLPVLPLPGTQD